jgi:CheY-like chemotaxis protein
MLVLLLDDEEWNISKLDEALKLCNFEVDYASTLNIALTYLRESQYDAVVTDFHMERLDGKQFISMLKGIYGNCTTIEELTMEIIEDVDEDIAEVINEEFEEFNDYIALVKKMEDIPFVLFSSATYGDGYDNVSQHGVFVEQKNNQDPKDYRAEKNIVEFIGQSD